MDDRPMITTRPFIRRADLRAEPDTLFVFGDNLARRGFGGQAKEMRGEPNAVGIPTKIRPETDLHAYFTDRHFDAALPVFRCEFDRLARHLRAHGAIVLPEDGIGTGRAQLRQRAPMIADYLDAAFAALRDITPHTLHDCQRDGCSPTPETCNFCRGGLAYCNVCGGGEGSLPTDCPGRKLTTEEQDAIYTAKTDFRYGLWQGAP